MTPTPDDAVREAVEYFKAHHTGVSHKFDRHLQTLTASREQTEGGGSDGGGGVMVGHRTYWFNNKFYCNNGKETFAFETPEMPMHEWLDMMVKYMEKFE